MKSAEVIVLQKGYSVWQKKGEIQKADGTITLVKSVKNTIIDTGLPKDKEVIIRKLKDNKLGVKDISVVICTHGDADHIGNLNLFPNAKIIVGFDIYDGDSASFFQKNFIVDENITITQATGHDDRSVCVMVKTEKGTVVITGDLFEKKNDWKNVKEWVSFSKKPKEHIKTRAKIWEIADFIVPGHGNMFKVDKNLDLLSVETEQLNELLKKNFNVYGDVEL